MTDYEAFQVPYSLVVVIAPHGQANKIVRFAREHGSSGATIVPVHGSRKNKWLRLFEIADIRRELIMMAVRHDIAGQLIEDIAAKFNFKAKNTGIAFSLPISHLLGKDRSAFDEAAESGKCRAPLGSALFVIVDEGVSDEIIDLSYREEVRGATVVSALGSAETSNLVFDFPISPQKELILYVGDTAKISKLQQTISSAIEIDRPGSGISFYVPVEHAAGLEKEED